jgi:hypothetical protein
MPSSALETLLMLPPLGIFIQASKITEKNPLLLAPTDKIEPTNVFAKKFSVEFPSRTNWLDPVSILPPISVIFYTDGSLLHGTSISQREYVLNH